MKTIGSTSLLLIIVVYDEDVEMVSTKTIHEKWSPARAYSDGCPLQITAIRLKKENDWDYVAVAGGIMKFVRTK